MYVKRIFIFAFFSIIVSNLYSQKDAVVVNLDAFSLSISKVKDFSKGYSSLSISDSIVQRNIRSLTDVLKFNSFIYFKENGLGMVSSPAFRGTSASHTAVLWNGININSQLNGQVDFNAISANSYDDITVRSGGGSVLFGSGAIGGSIHLNNVIEFLEKEKHQLVANYGSFNTKHISYDFLKTTKKNSFNIGVGYNSSENDFEYLTTNLTNENGSFYNLNFDFNYGYKINKKNQLKFYSNSFIAERNLSRTLNAPSNDAYNDLSNKNLLEWNYFKNAKENFSSRIAYIFEAFKYFDDNTDKSNLSEGNTKRKLFQLDYNNKISRKLQVNSIVGVESINASGTSFDTHNRQILSGVVSLNHQLTEKLSYGVQFRQELQSNFNSPFLYSIGLEHQFSKNYTFSFNTSKNFRVPTINDLYWNPGGNINLKPEDSNQYEIGNLYKYRDFSFQLNAYYIKSQDLIQWTPNNLGVWSPENINKSRNTGIELTLHYNIFFGNHSFDFTANYSHTDAKDLETGKQLISIPRNLGNFLINYKYKKNNFYYEFLMNDKAIFLVDTIPAFTVSNLGFNHQFLCFQKKQTIGLKINNIYNSNYQNTLNRPMPGINYQITTKINF
jgi:vitamin B12 transporter